MLWTLALFTLGPEMVLLDEPAPRKIARGRTPAHALVRPVVGLRCSAAWVPLLQVAPLHHRTAGRA